MEVKLTDREMDAMAVLWDAESATVTEVRERLPDELAYTTVLTVLRTLEAKGYASHTVVGKAHRYYPLVGRNDARESAVGYLVEKLFAGAPELLLSHLVSERTTREQLVRMRNELDRRISDLPGRTA